MLARAAQIVAVFLAVSSQPTWCHIRVRNSSQLLTEPIRGANAPSSRDQGGLAKVFPHAGTSQSVHAVKQPTLVAASRAPVARMVSAPLPAIVVVMRDGASEVAGNDIGLAGKIPCGDEIQGATMGVEQCEEKEGHSQSVIQKLMAADLSGAKKVVVSDLRHCGNLSVACATEVADDIIMKVRFSGLAVSPKCRKIADANMTAAGQMKSSTCQALMMKTMTRRLHDHDLNGALAMAQYGLKACVGLASPCDFQYGPLFMSQVRANMERQEVLQSLMAGLSQADGLMRQMIPRSRGLLRQSKIGSGHSKSAQDHAVPSLWRVAEKLQISFL